MCDFVTTEIIKSKNHNIKTYYIRNRFMTDLISLIASDACPLFIMEIKGTEIYKRKTNKHKTKQRRRWHYAAGQFIIWNKNIHNLNAGKLGILPTREQELIIKSTSALKTADVIQFYVFFYAILNTQSTRSV